MKKKGYDRQTKWIYFLTEDCIFNLLEKYNTIWDKVRADMKKEFNSEPVYKFKKKKNKNKNSR